MPLYARLAAIFTLCHRLLEIADPVLEAKVHAAVNGMLESLDDMLGSVLGNKTEVTGITPGVGLLGEAASSEGETREIYTIPPHIFQKFVEGMSEEEVSKLGSSVDVAQLDQKVGKAV